jgi:hypothetical protein
MSPILFVVIALGASAMLLAAFLAMIMVGIRSQERAGSLADQTPTFCGSLTRRLLLFIRQPDQAEPPWPQRPPQA